MLHLLAAGWSGEAVGILYHSRINPVWVLFQSLNSSIKKLFCCSCCSFVEMYQMFVCLERPRARKPLYLPSIVHAYFTHRKKTSIHTPFCLLHAHFTHIAKALINTMLANSKYSTAAQKPYFPHPMVACTKLLNTGNYNVNNLRGRWFHFLTFGIQSTRPSSLDCS